MTTIVPPSTRLTVREFESHPLAQHAELVHGEIQPMSPTGGAHAVIVANLFAALHAHVRAARLGRVFGDNAGYMLQHRDDTLRAPDVSYVRAELLPEAGVGNGWLTVAPNLVAEVLSPSDKYAEVVQRLDDYFAAGVPFVWLVDPTRRGVERRTPDGACVWIPEDGALDGAPVLPEFRLPVRELFDGVARPAAS